MQPLESSPALWLLGAADPGVVLLIICPQPRGARVSGEFGVYTTCPNLFLPSVWPLSSLLPCYRCLCALGVLRGMRLLKPGLWAPIPAFGGEKRERFSVILKERDSLGKKCEVFSPLQEGYSLQKMAQGPLPGPVQEGKQWQPPAGTLHF